MTMNERKAKQLNLRKATRFAVILNALQVATMLAVIAYVVRRGGEDGVELGVLLLGLVIVALGAALDIREAVNAQRIARQTAMLEDAYRQLEDLNATLRRQRHDFTNHLQVVFSLMELGDDAEAMRYVESVYADIRRAGSALKTAIPAVNALIAAKRAADDRDAVEGVEEQAQGVRDDRGDRTDNEIGQRNADHKHGEGDKEELHILVEVRPAPLLELRGNPHRKDDRNDRRGIAGSRHDDGDA